MDDFGFDICQRFQKPLAVLADQNMLTVDNEYICLTRKGFLCVDRILTEFFPEPFRRSSYW